MEEKKALYEFMGITGIGASFSPDGMKWVFPRRRLTQVDVKSREILDSFDAHDRDILNVVMPGDAATVVTGGIGPEILQWDLTTYRLKKRWSNPSGAQLLAISPDGGTLAVSTFQDTSVSLVRTADGMRTKLDGHGAALGGFAFDPSSDDRLVSMSVDGELHLWDTDRAIRLHTTPSEKVRGRNPFRTFSASGEGLMAVTLPGSGRVRILQASDLKTRSEIKVVPPETLIFMPIALSQDGRILATIFAGDDLKQPSVVALLDSATGSVIKRISSVSGLVTDLALSDDGALLAVASWERKSAADPPAHIFVYETSIGKMRHAFVGHEGMVRDMKFVPDGRLVTVSQDATALVWDVSENDRRQAR